MAKWAEMGFLERAWVNLVVEVIIGTNYWGRGKSRNNFGNLFGLLDNWSDSRYLLEEARKRKGSSLPIEKCS